MNQSDSMRLVAVGDVAVPNHRLRALRELDALKASIEAAGLLQPIVVDTSLRLVCGYHRLEACKQLGWDTIPALVRELDATRAQLAEIDENLCRHELSALERGEHTALRKKLFDASRAPRPTPSLADAASRAPGAKRGAKKTGGEPGFLDETAERTGRSKSTVSEDVRIGELPDDVRDAVRATPLRDKKKELLALTKMSREDQRAAVERVKAGESKSVRKQPEKASRVEMPVVPRAAKSGAAERASGGVVRSLEEAIDALGCALAGFPSGEAKQRAIVEDARDRLADVASRLQRRATSDASAA